MNVRTLCLAILHDGETTGYEIRKMSTEGEYAYFVEASYGSIYPALARLETDGMVTSRVEQQEGRPAKKIYAITPLGRETFHASLFKELGADVFRSEFLLFARFAAQLPVELVKTRLDERLAQMDEEIEHLKNVHSKRTTQGDKWIASYGTCCLTVARDHIASHMDKLIALAKPEHGQSDAAE